MYPRIFWEKVILMCFYTALPAVIIGFVFAAVQTKVFGLRNYISIGGWSMWFLIGIVISYSAMLWGYVSYVKRHIDDYQKPISPLKPLNKWIRYARRLSWCFVIFLVLGSLFSELMFSYIVHKMSIPIWYQYLVDALGILVVSIPAIIIGLCYYGLRTLDREKERGLWDGIIRITVALFFEAIVFLPFVTTYFQTK